MSGDLLLRWVIAAVLIAVAVWELTRLAVHRSDPQLRALAPGLLLLAFIATVAIPTPALRPVKHVFGPAWSPVVNGCWMAMACAAAVFFLLATPEQGTPNRNRGRRVGVEVAVLLIAVAVQAWVHSSAPPGTWHQPLQPQDYGTWRNITWTLSIDGYSLLVWCVAVVRGVRFRRHLTYSWLKVAVLLVIVGGTAMTLGVNGISLLTTFVGAVSGHQPAWFVIAYSIGQLGGQAALAAGLALIPIASAVVAVRTHRDAAARRRYARALIPLWRTVTDEAPHVRLSPTGAEGFSDITGEISDALAELSRYAPRSGGDIHDPKNAADMVATALRTARTDPSSPGAPPYPRIEPDFHSWKHRARWMLALGRELDLEPKSEEAAHSNA